MFRTIVFATLLKFFAIFLLNSAMVEANGKTRDDVTRDIAIAAIVIGGVAFLMSCISFCVPRPKLGRGSGGGMTNLGAGASNVA